MQLDKKNVKTALFAASCALLGSNAVAEDWEYDAAIMYYGESDRVQAVEGIFHANKDLKNGREFSGKVVLDSLTGASANGAVPQDTPQTFTSPSGKGRYEGKANEMPLDDSFVDTRLQLGGQWSQPLGENYLFSAGANLSAEFDYQSIAFNTMIGRYLNKKNTTLSLGLSYAFDRIQPDGGRPIALSRTVPDAEQFDSQEAFDQAFNATRQSGGDDSKNTLDIIFGLTQVINRRWITQFNFSLSEVDGYLTDAYKIVSEVNTDGRAISQRYESRPSTRSKMAFFAQSKYHFKKSVWDISYRISDDDWGLTGQSLETRYRYMFANNSYLEPHIRFYQQDAADFYQPFLLAGEALPEFVSADYRIGKLNTYTVGLKYGKKINNGREYGVRLEYYNQTPQDIGIEAPGQLAAQDLYPSINAVIVQFSYKY
ncbi:MAG: hypothetical protein COA42_15040 [Alteromonadaceae bacterium]|nr:MAG: hypothetical protein COA42_15040 [Alteromonadaceae bacterium]